MPVKKTAKKNARRTKKPKLKKPDPFLKMDASRGYLPLILLESKEIQRYFTYLTRMLAKHDHEQRFVYDLLRKIFSAGYVSAAIACREVFCSWEPPENIPTARSQMREITEQFNVEMAVAHAPWPAKNAN